MHIASSTCSSRNKIRSKQTYAFNTILQLCFWMWDSAFVSIIWNSTKWSDSVLHRHTCITTRKKVVKLYRAELDCWWNQCQQPVWSNDPLLCSLASLKKHWAREIPELVFFHQVTISLSTQSNGHGYFWSPLRNYYLIAKRIILQVEKEKTFFIVWWAED